MRIILGDHHPQALWALETSLQEEPEFEIVGGVADAEKLLELASAQSPDLVLLDLDLPGKSIEDLIVELHAQYPRPLVVVMSSNPDQGRRMLSVGADAFLSKSNDPEWLMETLKKFALRLNKKKDV